ncbi:MULTISPECIES: urea amidolyase associated protein UAAP1 [unclassified Agarivorans]|uniref:urea amidolyase associated protein UAAP1 n=1 Tax=unclassified Agarivorans TaxID=2636026 RepID=UPI0026E48522|nr:MULTISPECIES: urea amidolyase associated protein UAAP1 [unclassified Agarivorans]MDO6685001.1 urea carboxylase-associated family protein [Agarivorans sp. 3_MG-2023]MDO6717441.1 urea carboxylase-associated family protein [Agarivorans sp. 2_MG-2023]MDO6765353.1 urea carboxylase-associated family protein [Agarivorans sp. 1_MG-2023]
MTSSTQDIIYQETIAGAAHWSVTVPAGKILRFINTSGKANVSLLFHNPKDLLERYNAPDTLKCQHTFKLTKGNCLYSDMGRIFCSIVRDDSGWIDSVGGLANKQKVAAKWGERSYQTQGNQWLQNGYDSMLVELAKYGLGKRDMAANLNLFSKVATDAEGNLQFDEQASKAGDVIELRFEMDTLVLMSTCPHPMNPASDYPNHPVSVEMCQAESVSQDDYCRNFRPENGRGFENTERYRCETTQASCCVA